VDTLGLNPGSSLACLARPPGSTISLSLSESYHCSTSLCRTVTLLNSSMSDLDLCLITLTFFALHIQTFIKNIKQVHNMPICHIDRWGVDTSRTLLTCHRHCWPLSDTVDMPWTPLTSLQHCVLSADEKSAAWERECVHGSLHYIIRTVYGDGSMLQRQFTGYFVLCYYGYYVLLICLDVCL